ncbi:hypothetical protein BO71DRAFT_451516 [Aspergillus ellipticus CBS 707.79]|uniref:GED domain-containing protein n=1 Tax=Aspergillus ellipticus CBS 707.79 TaxID=1448320 RepID=A0A319D4A6_9EURO|nr:hypothetical protein BO71DRAFT_451516 [Aspergillus ellipticus CBS 707.79]
MRSVLLAEDGAFRQLQSEQSELLDKIDTLRSIGVGGTVKLPQIILCLRSYLPYPLPSESNVCTRFATEIIFRRTSSPNFKVSIEPGPSRTDEERQKLHKFSQRNFANKSQVPVLIEAAKECMGIAKNSDFSDDLLKIEMSGPDRPELTFVDLPGLCNSTSQDLGREGNKISRSITERYMKNNRSIILAVISAKTDYHLQEVLDIAKQYDGQQERTLGIITKPDSLYSHSEEEDTYLQLIKNEKMPLRGVPDVERDEIEKAFFNQGRWRSVSRECVGIESLRYRLSNILLKHIRHNIPGLVADIDQKITDRREKIGKLGVPRSNLQQQKGYLLSISSSFEKIAGQALNGMYSDQFFSGLEPASDGHDFRRLRAVVRDLNEYFAGAMNLRGSRRGVLGPAEQPLSPSKLAIATTGPYMHGWTPEYITRHDLEKKVSDQARRNRGIELPGTANPLLVGNLFRDQSKPWEEIARNHMMTTWETVRYFVHLLIRDLADERTYSALLGWVIEPELESMKSALLVKLDELTAYLKRGHPLPIGQSFLARIQESRFSRQLAALSSQLGLGTVSETSVTLDELKNATLDLEMSAYQSAATAIVTFVDNVVTLGIENCLLAPLEKIFTSQTINNMTDNQVQDIAAEPNFIGEERQRLSVELERLRTGLRTLDLGSPQRPAIFASAAAAISIAMPPTTQATSSVSNTAQSVTAEASKGTIKAESQPATEKPPPGTGLFGSSPMNTKSNATQAQSSTSGVFSPPASKQAQGTPLLFPGVSPKETQPHPCQPPTRSKEQILPVLVRNVALVIFGLCPWGLVRGLALEVNLDPSSENQLLPVLTQVPHLRTSNRLLQSLFLGRSGLV